VQQLLYLLIEQERLPGTAYAHQYIIAEFPNPDAAGNDFLTRHFHLIVGQDLLQEFFIHSHIVLLTEQSYSIFVLSAKQNGIIFEIYDKELPQLDDDILLLAQKIQ
jgi:hypothetical protein